MGTQAMESQDADKLVLALEGSANDDEGKTEEEIAAAKAEAAKVAEAGEGKTEEEKAAEAAEAERQKPLEIEENGVTRLETADEVTIRIAAEDAEAAKAADEGKPSEVDLLKEEVSSLRQMLRTSKRDMVQMGAKLARFGERSVGSEEGEEGEEGEGKAGKGGKVSKIEELQNAIGEVGATRGANLDILLETMAEGKYPDVKEVCSRANFDDIFEAIAAKVVDEKGGNPDEALLEVELNVWSRANPYSYMYGLIKKYHPTYANAKAEAEAGEGNKGEEDKSGKGKKIVNAPGSIGNLGGDSGIKSGWTAAKIDALPEDQLHTVPTDVYDKYMKNELD